MRKSKRFLAIISTALLLVLAACSGGNEGTKAPETEGTNSSSNEKTTLHLAALESAYGSEMWTKIAKAFEEEHKNVTVELTVEKNIEEVVRPNMQAGEYPDVFHLATSRKEALTETLIKENGLEELTDILDMNVLGEDVTVKDKLLPGFTDTLATNPYADGKTFLAPMFYSPTGLFYNAGLFEEKGWDVPETWDDMFELGEKAKAEGISLFTYPIAGYFDTLFGSMLYAAGGPDVFNKAMTYEDGIWESPEATKVFETIGKLAEYTHPNTVANGNPNDFTKNQQLILDNKALFMPNGTWIVEEMKEAPRAEGFEWAMMSVPAFEKGGDRYAFTFFEQIWIPKAAKNKEVAKEFITFLYSDKAASIFLEAGAIQPIDGITDKLVDGDEKDFYSVYDEGALPAMGTFASTKPVAGVNMGETLYQQIDSVISGKLSVEKWQESVEEVSDKLRPALK